jgi:hypothetical protein
METSSPRAPPPPPHAGAHAAIDAHGGPIPTFTWLAAGAAAAGGAAGPLDAAHELPALRASPAGAGALVATLNKGPFTLDLWPANDGGGATKECGTPPSAALCAAGEAMTRNLFFTRSFAVALRLLVGRGLHVRNVLFGGDGEEGWFVDGKIINGVTVRVGAAPAAVEALLEALVGPELARHGSGFTFVRRLVYLDAPARGGAPAWDAAFLATTLWHPSWALNEAQRLREVARLPAVDWWVQRRAPEWTLGYALPRALRGEAVVPPLEGPFRGELVRAPEVLAGGGALPAGAALEEVTRSRIVEQWHTWASAGGGAFLLAASSPCPSTPPPLPARSYPLPPSPPRSRRRGGADRRARGGAHRVLDGHCGGARARGGGDAQKGRGGREKARCVIAQLLHAPAQPPSPPPRAAPPARPSPPL